MKWEEGVSCGDAKGPSLTAGPLLLPSQPSATSTGMTVAAQGSWGARNRAQDSGGQVPVYCSLHMTEAAVRTPGPSSIKHWVGLGHLQLGESRIIKTKDPG